jgi:hypothetical protein
MRKVKFISILKGCATRRGYDPSELQPAQVAQIVEYINDRVKEGWHRFEWPEWTCVEERRFRPDYSGTVNYSIGEEVYWDGSYYACVSPVSGYDPSHSQYWEIPAQFDAFVAYEQPGQTKIVDVVGVYCTNPRVASFLDPLKYKLSDNGIQVHGAPSKVWVEFNPPAPEFSSDYWSSTKEYKAGEGVFDEPWENLSGTGECYKCISPHKNQQPDKKSPFWELIEFPHVLSAFVTRAVAADFLREDEQILKADAEDRIANDRLEEGFLNLTYKQKQSRRFSPAL